MAKAHRSPLLGYNHNVGHLGRVFHVQTEDSGPVLPRLFTHLFHEGTILVSRRGDYEAMLADDKVRALMQAQHRMVIKELAGGLFNERIVAFFRARGEELVVPQVPARVEGALPSARMTETPGPVVPSVPSPSRSPSSSAGVIDVPLAAAAVPVAAVPATSAPPRRTTRPIETQRSRKPTPPPITVRPPEPRRPPFVRSGAPVVAKTASTDGVVMQRSVVVGGLSSGGADGRQRIRPPVPYIVTGGSHPVRQVSPPSDGHAPGKSQPAGAGAPAPAVAPPTALETPGRAPSVFGPAIPEDKSLDEVILEYLSEDGD